MGILEKLNSGGVQKIVNLFLRSGSIGIRFLLTIVISKYFSLEFLGEYSLWNTTITLSLLFVGIDFYVYATRELLSKEYKEQFTIVFNQLIFIGISYVLILPLLGIVFFFDVLSPTYIVLFYLLVILEHFGMELYRLYINIERPLFANLLLFIRSALWVLVVFGIWWLNQETTPNISQILICWILGAFLSNLIGIVVLITHYKGTFTFEIHKEWIKKGVSVSMKLLFATCAQKVIEFSDRYMIDHYLGKKQLGVYTFYFQISNLINVIVYTVVIMILYPKLYKAIFAKNKQEIKDIERKMLHNTFFICLIFSLIEIISLPFITKLLGKPEVMTYDKILYIMLITTFVFNLFVIYKNSLQAYSADNLVVIIAVSGAIFNLIINFLFIEKIGLYAPVLSTVGSYTIMAIISMIYGKKHQLN